MFGNKLTKAIRFGYNNGNLWRRYIPNAPIDTNKASIKTKFEVGDDAQFAYKDTIKYPSSYKPHQMKFNPYIGIGILAFVLYFGLRYEHNRQQRGATYNHEYAF